MNKNIKNNDHESFMEGIYGCMERIEAGIIELQNLSKAIAVRLMITVLMIS